LKENIVRKIIFCLSLAFLVGCEIDNTASDQSSFDVPPPVTNPDDNNPPPVGTDPNAPPDSVDADEAEWRSIVWYTSQGPAVRSATRVMSLNASVDSGGRFIRFSWDRLPWSDGAMACFFVWNGSAWEGGKFEWIRAGGQSLKTTDNIRNGYNGLRIPAPGTPVAFAWTSRDLRQRSNLAKTTWR
jgi:hypothetical protein